MKITALAPWFGSKRTLAPRIVELLGPHRAYWEPFCGSMAVLLAKEPCRMETVNDLHGDLVNLACVLQAEGMAKSLYASLERTLMHEDLFKAAVKVVEQDMPGAMPAGERAYWFFVHSWMGRSGTSGMVPRHNGQFSGRYTNNGGHAATRWRNAIDSIPEWHERLRNVVILRRDAFEVIDKLEDAEGTVMYVDPPYIGVRAGRDGYRYEFTDGDHRRLAAALARFERTRVVVSYYEHPVVNALYTPDRWEKISIEMPKNLAAVNKRDKANDVKAVEVLLVNGATGNLF